MEETRQQIMDAVIDQFNEKGMKFTMDDISRELHISKKTIYKEFDDKDELFFATVDYGFSAIKKKEAEIIADESLNLVDKISRLIVCLPDNYKNIDFRRVYQLKDKYPKVYMKVAERVESDWGETEKLLNQAMDQGLRVEFYSYTIDCVTNKMYAEASHTVPFMAEIPNLLTYLHSILNDLYLVRMDIKCEMEADEIEEQRIMDREAN